MTSTEVVRRIRQNKLSVAEIVQWVRNAAELEAYRVATWLCIGSKFRSDISKELMNALGKEKDIYQKFVKYVCEDQVDKLNGFKHYNEFLTSTVELVDCVV